MALNLHFAYSFLQFMRVIGHWSIGCMGWMRSYAAMVKVFNIRGYVGGSRKYGDQRNDGRGVMEDDGLRTIA